MSRTVHPSNTNFPLRGNKERTEETGKKKEARTEANDCRANKINPNGHHGFLGLDSFSFQLLSFAPYTQVEYPH